MRFLLVEDQTMIRQQLRRFLEELFPAASVTEATSIADLRVLTAQHSRFDLALVDLELPDGNALEWIEEVAGAPDKPKIIILSAEHHEYVIAKAVHADVGGFVHKRDDTAVLTKAIHTVLEGGFFFSPTVQSMRTKMQHSADFFLKILSEREQQILQLVSQGFTDDEIAPLLTLKTSSVGRHRKNIMTKLGVHARDQLVAYGRSKGFDRITNLPK